MSLQGGYEPKSNLRYIWREPKSVTACSVSVETTQQQQRFGDF